MSVVIPVVGQPAGSPGSPYRRILTYSAKPVGTYVLNEQNFPGLGIWIPGLAFIVSSLQANSSVQITPDGGVTWRTLYPTGGGSVLLDSAGTLRVVIANAPTDIQIFIVGSM